MDDSRIEQLRREVLSQLGSSPSERATHDLESRVAALEAAVADLLGARPLPTAPRGHAHPSLQVLGPGGGGDRCVMEPDKPCVQSHACRTFGH
ncbi:MAG TPA: hypothetical protein VFE68_13070 [Vicinamibacteria bacterium]|nr:hypothetical protein [Vicinamibacteria bacterium]